MGLGEKKVPLEMFWLYVHRFENERMIVLFISYADILRLRFCIELLQEAFIPHEYCDIYL